MAATTRAYLCSLPSGAVVRARQADPVLLLATEAYVLPILTTAMATARKAEEEAGEPVAASDTPPTPLIVMVERLCRVCLLSPRCPEEIAFIDIPAPDAFALYQWSVGLPAPVEATPDGEVPWLLGDIQPLVKSNAALLVDMVARRYRTRPSVALGLEGAPWQFDLDVAVAYYAISAEKLATDRSRDDSGVGQPRHARAGGAGEVIVEDVFGNKHQVPRNILADTEIPSNAKVTDQSDLPVGWFGKSVH